MPATSPPVSTSIETSWPWATWPSSVPPAPTSTSSGCAPIASTAALEAALRRALSAASSSIFSISVRRSTGLVRKSSAPTRIASTALSKLRWPVRISVATCGCAALIFITSSSPLMPGSSMSVMIRSQSFSPAAAIADSAVGVQRTSARSRITSAVTAAKIASSSTSRIRSRRCCVLIGLASQGNVRPVRRGIGRRARLS